MCADVPDIVSCHYMAPRFSPSLPRHLSIVPTIVDITVLILAQKTTTTDRYWWSFGPAKFDAATAGFDAKTRRAITRSMSAISCHIIHQNVDADVVYHRANRYSDTTFLSTLFNTNSTALWTGMPIRHHATTFHVDWVDFFIPTHLYHRHNKRQHEMHLHAKMDVNRPILMKLRLGDFDAGMACFQWWARLRCSVNVEGREVVLYVRNWYF